MRSGRTIPAQDATRGTFSLAAGLSGNGQLRRGTTPIGALRWSATGEGSLDLLGASHAEVTPSAAARDFQLGPTGNTPATFYVADSTNNPITLHSTHV